MTIYTCTLNLAIDLFIETEELVPFVVNRTKEDDIQANGKGVNVSLILKMLGIDNTALGVKAGFTGNYVEDYLKEKEITTDFIEVAGTTRINVFTKVTQDQKEYKLVNKGPKLSEEHVRRFLKKISELRKGDYLCVSGSLPQGVSPSILIEISRICFEKQVFLILDSSYEEILDCLPYQPFLLKPNEEELQEWFHTEVQTKDDYIFYGQELLKRGAKNILLSLGSEGALFMNNEKVLSGNSPTGMVVNTACSGDAMLGTLLAGWHQGLSLEKNLKRSIAAGSSTAFRKGLTDFSDVQELEQQIKIQEEE